MYKKGMFRLNVDLKDGRKFSYPAVTTFKTDTRGSGSCLVIEQVNNVRQTIFFDRIKNFEVIFMERENVNE